MYYLAGIVDGEGSFYISAEKTEEFTFNFRLRPRFRLEMKDIDDNEGVHKLIKELCDELGITSLNQRKMSKGTQRSEISGMTDIADFSSALKPYLRVKDYAAEEMEKFRTVKGRHITEERFLSLLEARKRIRKRAADRDTKYDYETIREGMTDD